MRFAYLVTLATGDVSYFAIRTARVDVELVAVVRRMVARFGAGDVCTRRLFAVPEGATQ